MASDATASVRMTTAALDSRRTDDADVRSCVGSAGRALSASTDALRVALHASSSVLNA